MSEAKHTPGPLYVEEDGDMNSFDFRIVEEAALQRRREIGSSARPDYLALVVKLGDARLFAAAPELLDAAKSALEAGNKWNMGLLTKLEEAIAKAEG